MFELFLLLLMGLIKCLHPDSTKSFVELSKTYGYPLEEHFITTKDGYILRFFRIQRKNQPKIVQYKPVLYIQHGLADSSDNFIINREEWAPAFYFANKNFDVWLGNSRGNKHSRNHTSLNPDKDKKFWDFSFDDLVAYDLPASFEYIVMIRNIFDI